MGSRWTSGLVLEAAREWVWIPDDAERATTPELDIVGYPDYFVMPTQVMRASGEAPFDELLARARGIAEDWGRRELFWWVGRDDQRTDIEEQLLKHGAVLVEETDILAIELAAEPVTPGSPADFTVRRVCDEATVRDAEAIAAAAFDTEPTPDSRLTGVLAEVEETWRGRTSFRSIAYLDDLPVATAGCTLADEVARLWGAGVLAEYRGKGAYRAVLQHRLGLARSLGASLALTKGRTNTSGPILRRAGFERYGVERCYRLTW